MPLRVRENGPTLVVIGHVESPLTDPKLAPKQGSEGSPDAWLVFRHSVRDGLSDLREGDEVIVLTWLDRAERDTLRVYPRDDVSRTPMGVFSTPSADRHHEAPTMTEMSIRRATLRDAPRLAALSEVSGYPAAAETIGQRLRRLLERTEEVVLVAEPAEQELLES
jgi:hypothetical protein